MEYKYAKIWNNGIQRAILLNFLFSGTKFLQKKEPAALGWPSNFLCNIYNRTPMKNTAPFVQGAQKIPRRKQIGEVGEIFYKKINADDNHYLQTT